MPVRNYSQTYYDRHVSRQWFSYEEDAWDYVKSIDVYNSKARQSGEPLFRSSAPERVVTKGKYLVQVTANNHIHLMPYERQGRINVNVTARRRGKGFETQAEAEGRAIKQGYTQRSAVARSNNQKNQ